MEGPRPVEAVLGNLALGMNFLGHLYVSGEDPMVIVGNFMADGVKGRDLSGWSPKLQQGIRMHRHIDSFTDTHPLTLLGRERLRAHCGKYAGVALDLFYDHVIASQWSMLRAEPLQQFAQRMYTLLSAHSDIMPERAQHMLPYMVEHDWLNTYATIPGLGRALAGLARRSGAGDRLAGSETVLKEHIEAYTAECLAFLPLLETHLANADDQR